MMNKSLQHISIVVTRDINQSGEFVSLLQEKGADIIMFPVIQISAPEDWSETDEVLHHIQKYDLIIFTSSNSVSYFVQRAALLNIKLSEIKLAIVGSSTSKALSEFNLTSDIIPDNYSSSELIKILKKQNLSGMRILYPCSEKATDDIPEELKKEGALVEKLVVYTNRINKNIDSKSMQEKLQTDSVDCITFFSPSAVQGFIDLVLEEGTDNILKQKTKIAAIGKTTKTFLQEKGMDAHIIPEQSTVTSMVEAITNYYEGR